MNSCFHVFDTAEHQNWKGCFWCVLSNSSAINFKLCQFWFPSSLWSELDRNLPVVDELSLSMDCKIQNTVEIRKKKTVAVCQCTPKSPFRVVHNNSSPFNVSQLDWQCLSQNVSSSEIKFIGGLDFLTGSIYLENKCWLTSVVLIFTKGEKLFLKIELSALLCQSS